MADFGEPLSERELDVLKCVVKGVSNQEIALDLSISPNTVKVHLRNIFTKLGVASRTEATTVALQQGLLSMPGVAVPEPVAVEPAEPEPPTDPISSLLVVEPVPESPPITAAPPLTVTLPPRPVARWRWLGLGLLLLVGLPLLVLVGFRLVGGNATATPPPATPEPPFAEQPMGEGWLSSRPMPGERAGMASAAVGLNLYLIGGETAEGVTGTVVVYDIGSRLWHTVESKPTGVADVSAAVLFGEIYVPGGRLATGEPTDVVEAYSPTNNAWRPVADLPRPIAGGLTLADHSSLYLFGGWDGETALADSYLYDPTNGRWRPIAPMSQPRAWAAGGIIGNRPYVVGGFDGESELDLCQYYEVIEDAWHDCPPLLQARGKAGAAVLLNKLYVVGGGEAADSEVYDAETQTWTALNTPMLDDRPGWTSLAVTTVETRIYVLGGRSESEILPTNYVYQPFVYRFYMPSTSFGNEPGDD
jgi:DNA-binding CsgD family transcriptional regulator